MMDFSSIHWIYRCILHVNIFYRSIFINKRNPFPSFFLFFKQIVFFNFFFWYYKLSFSVHKRNYIYSWTNWVHIYKPWENSCLFNLITSWYSSVDKYLAVFRPNWVYFDTIFFKVVFFLMKMLAIARSR